MAEHVGQRIPRAQAGQSLLHGLDLRGCQLGFRVSQDPRPRAAEQLRQQLDPLQYRVTQQCGTEPPFQNEYWDEHRAGIYVDIVSGEPLFSSIHKYKSGTGWPSFDRPLEPEHIVRKTDYKLILPRTEVRSRYGDSHLGHVFEDGPDTTGLRYCINSISLDFVPAEAPAEKE